MKRKAHKKIVIGTSLVSGMRYQLARYLNGGCGLRRLEEWIVLNMQHVLDSEDEQVIKMMNEIDGLIICYGQGDFTMEELREKFRSLL